MKRILTLFTGLLMAVALHAAPNVTAVSGSASYGSTLQLTATGIGTKPYREQQTFFADFEDSSRGISGSTWGYVTSMASIAGAQRATTNCWDGSGCLGELPGWETGNQITAAIVHGALAASDKFSIEWDWESDAPAAGGTAINLKVKRWWPANANSKNNWYGAQQTDSGFVNLVENLLDGGIYTNGINRFYTTREVPNGTTFTQVEDIYQLNSSGNATDGIAHTTLDGNDIVNTTTWQSNTTNDTNANGRYGVFFPVHMVFTGPGTPIASGTFARYDNIIADLSWCAVWATTSSTWHATDKKYPMVIQTWSGSTITAIFVTKKFAAGTTLYAYVRANDGTINATGRPFTVASGSSIAPAPTVSAITPNTGLTTGGEARTITGTNFALGVVVSISGTTCATTFVNSTTLTIVTPALPAGVLGVTALNTDLQNGSLPASYTVTVPSGGGGPTITNKTLPWIHR